MSAPKRFLGQKRTLLIPFAPFLVIIISSAALIAYSAFAARHAKMATVAVRQEVIIPIMMKPNKKIIFPKSLFGKS